MLTRHHITQYVTNLKNKYSLFWKHKLTNSPKLHFLSTFIKSEFKIEEYLNHGNNPTYRRLLTQFRVSCHTLNIEQGRYCKIPREQRFCEFCDANEIEDEHHFSRSCKYYEQQRKYLNSILKTKVNTPINFETNDDLLYLLSSTDPDL